MWRTPPRPWSSKRSRSRPAAAAVAPTHSRVASDGSDPAQGPAGHLRSRAGDRRNWRLGGDLAFFPSLDKYAEGLKEMDEIVGVGHVSIGTSMSRLAALPTTQAECTSLWRCSKVGSPPRRPARAPAGITCASSALQLADHPTLSVNRIRAVAQSRRFADYAAENAARRCTISLPAGVVEMMRAHRQAAQRLLLGLGRPSAEDYVFTLADGSPCPAGKRSRGWGNVMRNCKLPCVLFHALCHSTPQRSLRPASTW